MNSITPELFGLKTKTAHTVMVPELYGLKTKSAHTVMTPELYGLVITPPYRYENIGCREKTWRYGVTKELTSEFSKTGYGFYQGKTVPLFPIPVKKEIWVKFDVYNTGTKWRAFHNDTSNGTKSNGIMFNNGLQAYSNNSNINTSTLTTNQLHTILLHMVSGSLLEYWVDGEKVHTYEDNVNYGLGFGRFFLQSEGSDVYFSNIIISESEIGLDENVTIVKQWIQPVLSAGISRQDGIWGESPLAVRSNLSCCQDSWNSNDTGDYTPSITNNSYVNISIESKSKLNNIYLYSDKGTLPNQIRLYVSDNGSYWIATDDYMVRENGYQGRINYTGEGLYKYFRLLMIEGNSGTIHNINLDINIGDVEDTPTTEHFRYENFGTADLLKVSGTTVRTEYSKYGTAFYTTSPDTSFPIPSCEEVWMKFDAVHTGDNEFSAGNRSTEYGTNTLFGQNWSGYRVYTMENRHGSAGSGSYTEIGSISRNVLHTYLIHIKSGECLEVWIDGNKVIRKEYNVNGGNNLNAIFIQSSGSSNLFSNVIISDQEIGLNEDVEIPASDFEIYADTCVITPFKYSTRHSTNFTPSTTVTDGFVESDISSTIIPYGKALCLAPNANQFIDIPTTNEVWIRFDWHCARLTEFWAGIWTTDWGSNTVYVASHGTFLLKNRSGNKSSGSWDSFGWNRTTVNKTVIHIKSGEYIEVYGESGLLTKQSWNVNNGEDFSQVTFRSAGENCDYLANIIVSNEPLTVDDVPEISHAPEPFSLDGDTAILYQNPTDIDGNYDTNINVKSEEIVDGDTDILYERIDIIDADTQISYANEVVKNFDTSIHIQVIMKPFKMNSDVFLNIQNDVDDDNDTAIAYYQGSMDFESDYDVIRHSDIPFDDCEDVYVNYVYAGHRYFDVNFSRINEANVHFDTDIEILNEKYKVLNKNFDSRIEIYKQLTDTYGMVICKKIDLGKMYTVEVAISIKGAGYAQIRYGDESENMGGFADYIPRIVTCRYIQVALIIRDRVTAASMSIIPVPQEITVRADIPIGGKKVNFGTTFYGIPMVFPAANQYGIKVTDITESSCFVELLDEGKSVKGSVSLLVKR